MASSHVRTIHTFPQLCQKNARGSLKIWTISVEKSEDGTHALTRTTTGLQDGKLTTHTRATREGKNIGRANETTFWEQAVKEAESKWRKKQEREGYVEVNSDNATTHDTHDAEQHKLSMPMLPMLATGYYSAKKARAYPAYAQPKLDGIRCVAHVDAASDTIRLMSRQNSAFTGLDHLVPTLHSLLRGHATLYLDGELYTQSLTFQQISGIVRAKSDTSQKHLLQYHVYDVYDAAQPQLTYDERHALLKNVMKTVNCASVVVVETVGVHNDVAFERYKAACICAGYEGAMWRDAQSTYRTDYRSPGLQKAKDFKDAEYEIVGFKEARGNDAGTVIWVCCLPDNKAKTFAVRPTGTREQRRDWFSRAQDHVGKMLTVEFQELTNDGVPRFGVGKAIRDYE